MPRFDLPIRLRIEYIASVVGNVVAPGADWEEFPFMDVACSTLCFTREPFEHALRHIAELEFSKVDLAVDEDSPHLTPNEVLSDQAGVLHRIRQGPTIGVAAITLRTKAQGDELVAQVDGVAHLAKQLACSLISVDASSTTTPFDAEVTRLTNLVKTASLHGAVLAVTTKMGTHTETPTGAIQLCEQVAGLGLCLDPSHYVCGPHQAKPFDEVYPYVRNVHLRDTGRRVDQMQVKVGRGEIEYGRIVTSLKRYQYRGSLVVDIEDRIPSELDVEAEVRKLRLLLESLL